MPHLVAPAGGVHAGPPGLGRIERCDEIHDGRLGQQRAAGQEQQGEAFAYRITVPETPLAFPLYDVRIIDDLLTFLRQNPEISILLLKSMAQRVQASNAQLMGKKWWKFWCSLYRCFILGR